MNKEDFELFLLYVSDSGDMDILKVEGRLDEKIENYFIFDSNWKKEHSYIPLID